MAVREANFKTGALTNADPYFVQALSTASGDVWVLTLPPLLKAYEPELELLLDKVFAGRPRSRENLELAQQMTLNWCTSKCKKMGIALEETMRDSAAAEAKVLVN